MNEIKDNIDVYDNGEWNFKLNVAVASFKDFDIDNFDIKQLKYVISGSSNFIDLIENTTPHEDKETVLLKDYSFLKEK